MIRRFGFGDFSRQLSAVLPNKTVDLRRPVNYQARHTKKRQSFTPYLSFIYSEILLSIHLLRCRIANLQCISLAESLLNISDHSHLRFLVRLDGHGHIWGFIFFHT
ncbi:hypothetical protein Barb6_01109 [Bacteroidales bacterium Barb6]|nr:hypothetical protein Barb6_01109 [Bacteroidales bacterium Barb6]